MWVFLNGQLALDLGGVHDPEIGTLGVDAVAGQATSSISGGPTTNNSSLHSGCR